MMHLMIARLDQFAFWKIVAGLCVVQAIGCGQNQEQSLPAKPHDAVTLSQPVSTVSKLLAPPKPAGELPRFVRADDARRINFERYDDQTGLHRILEVNGGGTAITDFDHDGEREIVFTNGCQLPLRLTDREHRTQVFRFGSPSGGEDITSTARLEQFGYSSGCATGDINNDGFEDLYVAAFGPNALWVNNGDGTFSVLPANDQLRCGSWSTSPAFGDFNRDGWLDLYVTTYVKFSDEHPRLCPTSKTADGYMQCSPTLFEAADDFLFVSNGDGTFQDTSMTAGILAPDGKGLGVVVFDSNDDGWPDIYVANDGVPNFLFINESNQQPAEPSEGGTQTVRFTNRAFDLGAAVSYTGDSEASMGVTSGDVDGNGTPELFMTNFYLEKNTLYVNQGRSGYLDLSNESGLATPSRPMLGFGTEFLDFNNDGSLDLFVTNGHVDDFSWDAKKTPYAMPPQFFRNNGKGHFDDVSRWSGDYFEGKWIGRGMACGDLDDDGDLDMVVSHQRSRSAVLLNETPTKSGSVMLRLIGTGASNRSAVGARLQARCGEKVLHRYVGGGGSFQSASAREVHLGLAKATMVDAISIRWPSGFIQELGPLEGGALYVVVEGQEAIRMSRNRESSSIKK